MKSRPRGRLFSWLHLVGKRCMIVQNIFKKQKSQFAKAKLQYTCNTTKQLFAQ